MRAKYSSTLNRLEIIDNNYGAKRKCGNIMEREEYKVTCRKIRIEVPLSKARVIWLQYLYFLLILMTNLDFFFFLYLVHSSLVHLLLSHSRIRKLWMVTKGRNFIFKKKEHLPVSLAWDVLSKHIIVPNSPCIMKKKKKE